MFMLHELKDFGINCSQFTADKANIRHYFKSSLSWTLMHLWSVALGLGFPRIWNLSFGNRLLQCRTLITLLYRKFKISEQLDANIWVVPLTSKLSKFNQERIKYLLTNLTINNQTAFFSSALEVHFYRFQKLLFCWRMLEVITFISWNQKKEKFK